MWEIRYLFDLNSLRNLIGIQHTLISIFSLDIKRGEVDKGIYNIKTILDKHKNILPPDLIASSYKTLGFAYTKQDNPKEAARNYMYAVANYFKYFQNGAYVFYLIEGLLKEIKELGDEETKGEAILIDIGINKLMAKDMEIQKDICISERIEPLKEALDGNGNRSNLVANNEIESMINDLSEEILSGQHR